jgi:hypothetical protein
MFALGLALGLATLAVYMQTSGRPMAGWANI